MGEKMYCRRCREGLTRKNRRWWMRFSQSTKYYECPVCHNSYLWFNRWLIPYLFLAIILSIFISEFIVMLILAVLPPFSFFTEAIINALLLTCIIFPMLYYILVTRLRLNVSSLKKF